MTQKPTQILELPLYGEINSKKEPIEEE